MEGSLQKVSKTILKPRWKLVWPCEGCLFVWPHNPIGQNEDVMFTWRRGMIMYPTLEKGKSS